MDQMVFQKHLLKVVGRAGPPTDCYRIEGTTTEKPEQTKEGEITMQCIYKKPLGTGVGMYYFNGVDTVHIQNNDTAVILRKIYKENNGENMPEFTWTSAEQWHIRSEAVAPNLK